MISTNLILDYGHISVFIFFQKMFSFLSSRFFSFFWRVFHVLAFLGGRVPERGVRPDQPAELEVENKVRREPCGVPYRGHVTA